MRFLLFLIILNLTQFAIAGGTIATVKKGPFSLGVYSGYSQMRTLNADATSSKFSGVNYGAQFEVSLSQNDGGGDIRIFGSWSHEDLKESANTFKMQANALGGGLKFFANENVYLQVGYGEINQKFTNSTISYSIKNKYLSSALGFDFAITDSLFLGLALQYLTNPIKKTENISSNSFSESGQALILLTWSPPITIINTTAPTGR